MNNLLLEGIKDNAIAVAKKVKKENSPDFQKLMGMLDKDRGLMVVFTKWLFGIPTGKKEELKDVHKMPFGRRPGGRPVGRHQQQIPGDERELDDLGDIEMPR